MPSPCITILGAGRMGQGLALALSGRDVSLVARTAHPVAPPLRLHRGARSEAVRRGDALGPWLAPLAANFALLLVLGLTLPAPLVAALEQVLKVLGL